VTPRFFVVDGPSQLYRAYHALGYLSNSRGVPTHAVFGMSVMLWKLLREEEPDYVAVAWDAPGPTFRHEAFEAYKETRPGMPADLAVQIPYVKSVIDAFRIPLLELPGYEADDILGTLVARARDLPVELMLVTADKDTLQLVSPKVRVLSVVGRTGERLVYDEEKVRERWGVGPAQIPDLLALMGDQIDNIPGVPGIGETTARKLLAQFESLDRIYENLFLVGGHKLREALAANRKQALMSRELATINQQVPLEFDLEAFKRQEPDWERLRAIWTELEFSSLLRQLPQPRVQVTGEPARLLDSAAALSDYLAALPPGAPLALEWVGEGRAPDPVIRGLGLFHPGPGAAFVPLDSGFPDPGDRRLIGHDMKLLIEWMFKRGMPLPAFEDSAVAAYLLNPARVGYKLEEICLDSFGEGPGPAPPVDASREEIAARAGERARWVRRYWTHAVALLEEQGLLNLYEQVERPLVPVLGRMELWGIRADPERLEGFAGELEREIDNLTRQIHALAGEPFNIGSPKQLAHILFEKLKLPTVKRTRTGYSTDADVLEQLALGHELPARILEYRSLSKLKSTYADVLPTLIHPATGRIHTSFNQLVTATGRLSSSDPNVQNIPIRTELGRRIREAFVPEQGWRFLAADYSQIELRILAHLSGEEALIESFRRDEDIHTRTASEVFGVAPEAVTAEMRRVAKCVSRGTLVCTSEGLRPIESLAPTPESGGVVSLKDIKVWTDAGLAAATQLYYDGIRPGFRIRLKSGLEVACTRNHRFRVMDSRGRYTWRRACALRVGDYVGVKLGTKSFGHEERLPEFEYPEARKVANFRDIDLPRRWSPELARFLGYLISEGYVYRHPTKAGTGAVVISQAESEREVVEDLVQVSKALFGSRARVRTRDGSVFVSIRSGKLVWWLEAIGATGRAGEKNIPDLILAAPYTIQAEFLRALFSGDGCMKSSGRQVTYATKSRALATRLQQMLLNVGYLFSLWAEARTWKGQPYRIFVLGLTGMPRVARFVEEIGFVSKRKDCAAQGVPYDRTVIPFQEAELTRHYDSLRGRVREKAYEVLRARRPVQLNRARAGMIVNQLKRAGVVDDWTNLVEWIVDNHIVFLPVVGIEEEVIEAFDLVVPERRCYVANGMVSHNTVNFGVIYGVSAFGLSQAAGVDQKVAQKYLDDYFARHPKVKAYLDATLAAGREKGYVSTLLGRRRYLPELKSSNPNARGMAERMAMNAPIQGTASDLIKIAMVRMAEALAARGLASRMLLQVHDELLFEAPPDEIEVLDGLAREIMEGAMTLAVPIKVDIKTGQTWAEV
jgi:DNA polymerase I-like protein with 3'-5' exonuclease and polymerase domains/5'-3' exonuclease/intein/homing endonuclease